MLTHTQPVIRIHDQDNGNIKTIPLDRKYHLNYCLEQAITNGLGYQPVREVFNEGEITTQEGLIRHLANMELTLDNREDVRIREFYREALSRFLGVEDIFKKTMETYNHTFEFTTKLLAAIRKEMSSKSLKFSEELTYDISKLNEIRLLLKELF